LLAAGLKDRTAEQCRIEGFCARARENRQDLMHPYHSFKTKRAPAIAGPLLHGQKCLFLPLRAGRRCCPLADSVSVCLRGCCGAGARRAWACARVSRQGCLRVLGHLWPSLSNLARCRSGRVTTGRGAWAHLCVTVVALLIGCSGLSPCRIAAGWSALFCPPCRRFAFLTFYPLAVTLQA